MAASSLHPMANPSMLFFLLAFLSLFAFPSVSAAALRRFLHQPVFFPLDSFPPSSSPQPQPQPQQQQPKLPFSSTTPTPQTQQRPFFPSSTASPPPPPPPPSSYLATFPANISSLLLPTSPSSSSSSSRRRLAAVVVSVTLLSVALLFALSALLLFHRRHRNVGGYSDDKCSQVDSLRLFPPNASSSDAVPLTTLKPPHYASASSSTEFLYLGTLSSSNPHVDVAPEAAASDSITSTRVSHQKLGSPELRPLPPLPRMQNNWSGNASSFYDKNEEAKKEEQCDDGEEEFFSPRGSSGRRDTTSSPDFRRASMNPQRESEFLGQFGNRGLNPRNASCPYSVVSGSSRNSVSNSDSNGASPQLDLSPPSLKLSPPEAILDFLAPSRVSVPPAVQLNSSSSSSLSSSPVSEMETCQLKGFSGSAPNVHRAKNLPPPPPPVPPPRFWENPIDPDPTTRPPVLVEPSRPVILGNPVAPPDQELQRSGSGGVGESTEETPKPKLKPLHWDKVRASSDRAMAWDQIKSSSFQ